MLVVITTVTVAMRNHVLCSDGSSKRTNVQPKDSTVPTTVKHRSGSHDQDNNDADK